MPAAQIFKETASLPVQQFARTFIGFLSSIVGLFNPPDAITQSLGNCGNLRLEHQVPDKAYDDRFVLLEHAVL